MNYPQWRDVGVPDMLVSRLRSISGSMLDYLVLNKVFRFQVKPQYTYMCQKCGTSKKIGRPYEDYSSCQKCSSSNLNCSVGWRMGKDQVRPFSNTNEGHAYAPRVLAQMADAYRVYFGQTIPENFFQSGWAFDENSEKPIMGGITASSFEDLDDGEDEFNDSNEPSLDDAKCTAQFIGGEKVESKYFPLSVARAAILCPFLWDDQFDWKFGIKKDKARETHIIPLFYIWSRYQKSAPSLVKRKSSHKGGNKPCGFPIEANSMNDSPYLDPVEFTPQQFHPSKGIQVSSDGSILDNDIKIVSDIVDSIMAESI